MLCASGGAEARPTQSDGRERERGASGFPCDIKTNTMYADVVGRQRWQARKSLRCGWEAIREYVALNNWQIDEIHKGLAEAERGEFASESEVKRVAKKWTRRAR